ncbi:MAG: response regulator [Campylobacterales bacterium]
MEQVGNLKDISILYAEDEPDVLHMVSIYLSRRVKYVHAACNGVVALEIFKKEHIDIIITDITMPEMDGLSLISYIREIDSEIPIVVISAHYESGFLLQAIDFDVTSFLTKPFHKTRFDKALHKCFLLLERQRLKKELEAKNEDLGLAYNKLEIAKQKEIELLSYKDKYHTWQEESAFKKQVKLIKDELYYRYQNGIFFSSRYEPLDILSGDSYGTVEIDEDRYLLFMFDATGKGLSASVTSILLTAYINNSIEVSRAKSDYELKKLINSFVSFIKKQLLGDEILGAIFLEIDTSLKKMSFANFGMPPIFYESVDGEVVELESNNQPISPYIKDSKLECVSFEGIKKLLMVSDGVFEAPLKDNRGVYYKKISEDLKSSLSINELFESFDMAIEKRIDDVSAIYLFFADVKKLVKRSFVFQSTLLDVDEAILHIASLLEDEVDSMKLESFQGALFEVLINSLEHGSFGIDYSEKKVLIAQKMYDKVIRERQNDLYFSSKEIKCELITTQNSLKKCFGVIITDSGEGFDVVGVLKEAKIKSDSLFSGRGIKMAQIYSEGLFYSKSGNVAYLFLIDKI